MQCNINNGSPIKFISSAQYDLITFSNRRFPKSLILTAFWILAIIYTALHVLQLQCLSRNFCDLLDHQRFSGILLNNHGSDWTKSNSNTLKSSDCFFPWTKRTPWSKLVRDWPAVFVDVPNIDLFALPNAFVLPENKLLPDVPVLPKRPPVVAPDPKPPKPPRQKVYFENFSIYAYIMSMYWY